MTQFLMMHKTEKKYEVGKVADKEEAKQRQFNAILNKLTPQKFAKLLRQAIAIGIDNGRTLRGVITQIFDRAVMEPIFCEVYANLCYHLSGKLPDFTEDNEKISFKRLLLNKCQEEFERKEIDKEKQSKEEREEIRIEARRRKFGNIRLLGELYKKKILTERIMHVCIKEMLGQQHQTSDEEDVEALCILISTIGEIIDHPKAKKDMDEYFEGIETLSNNMEVTSRIRMMLMDVIDLRKNKWQQRRKVERPKMIKEVRRDAAKERQQARASRLGRGPGINPSGRRGLPMNYGPRESAMLSSERPEGKWSLSVPLTQRPVGEDAIILAPPSSITIGMFGRESPSMQSALQADVSPPSNRDSEREAPTSTEKTYPEELLLEKSRTAIKEFYSARDEKEIALCIKELNSPSFHQTMISLWVTDSFDRKDIEREILAKLLVNLTKFHSDSLSQSQLIKGFESVLTTLEDTIIDAPKAPEYLGRIFAKIITENVASLGEIGQLIHDGGEKPGSLLNAGLAADVLGNVLEIIRSEKGEDVFNDIITNSNLRLETFQPPDPIKSRILEKFI